MKEFSIIERFFTAQTQPRQDVMIGVGDDCAITTVPTNQSLATTTDTLVAGTHFLHGTHPSDIAHKALAVNLSDLAAVGAVPAWINLALSLEEIDEDWLDDFSDTLARLCEYYGINLIGGDTTKGPLSITITAQGFVPPESVATRSGANRGDLIYVTGTLGDAGAGLDTLLGKLDCYAVADLSHQEQASAEAFLRSRHHRPTPRLLAGTALRRTISSCIDISDGLLGDIQHIMKASQCGAIIHVDKLPISEHLAKVVSPEQAMTYALSSGDDYELCFTLPEHNVSELETLLNSSDINFTCVGQMVGGNELSLMHHNMPYTAVSEAFEHQFIVQASSTQS
jgi:thiamine-monophosphate kinase